MSSIDNELWAHFQPLWQEFQSIGGEVLVAGGYGLFLKQQWLLQQEAPTIVLPLNRWQDATPRVTKDLDLVIGLDLIADETRNGQLLEALQKNGFAVSEKAAGKRWQFVKELGKDRRVIAELHTPNPSEENQQLKADKIRVKHKPSLGDEGVHGRLNPEAVGGNIHPFSFSYDETKILLPNAVTWTVMKLTAAQDRWHKSQDANADPELRSFSRAQAIKHGNDVFRTVAMMSMDERDECTGVKEAIRETSEFQKAASIYRDFFVGTENWADEVLKDKWLPADLEVIHSVLASWYNA
jgi:hypothetical protein